MRWLALTPLIVASTALADLSQDIASLLKVDKEGSGNEAASIAWQSLAKTPVTELPQLLSAMNEANPLAANWLRAAIRSISDGSKGKLPLSALEAFLKDGKNSSAARTLAFDLIREADSKLADTLTPSLLEDTSAELRRYPIGQLQEEADKALEKGDKPGAAKLFSQAFQAARDEDQIKALSKKLKDLGQPIDMPQHFGFLMNWRLIAPFTNNERKGFDTVYPPEEEIDFTKSYEGKGKQAAWTEFTSKDDYGKIDFNKPFGMEKQVVGYAATTFESATARKAELRLGCKNGWKIWLNGKLVFARDEYHRGAKLDQYKLPVDLKAGPNIILLKCCQNEQTEQWTVEWEFQLRICDSTGTAILAAK
jgi:hypothetical protein